MIAALVMLTLGLGTALIGLAGTAQAAPKKEHKVYICKYVSKPGEAERLQSGQNPIFTNWTSVPGATSYADVQIGDEFADKHGRSVVIAKGLKQDPEPSVADCPQPEEPDTDTQSEFRAIEGDPDCESGTVPFYEEKRTRTVTEGQDPGPWSAWTKIEGSDDTRPLNDEEEAECPDIAGKDTQFDEDKSGDCEAGTVTTTSRFRQGTETAPGSGEFEYGPWQEGKTKTRDMTAAELDECDNGGDPGDPGDAEVLGIEANAPAAAAPAAAPTAVDAGVIAEQSGSDTSSWLLAGAALALMGAALGLTPARSRGKRVR